MQADVPIKKSEVEAKHKETFCDMVVVGGV